MKKEEERKMKGGGRRKDEKRGGKKRGRVEKYVGASGVEWSRWRRKVMPRRVS